MDSQSELQSNSQNGVQNGMNRVTARSDQNYVGIFLQKNLVSESFAKFQQVLDYIDEQHYIPLYQTYNTALSARISTDHNGPRGNIDHQKSIAYRIKFYSFRFISNVGRFLFDRFGSDQANQDKSEKNFISLIKILLYHALTARHDTANLALVELQQLCVIWGTNLQSLYYKYRAKFLRLIIKAILVKLSKGSENEYSNGNGQIDGNGSSWTGRGNRVITYMTRALEVFNVGTVTNEDIAQSLIITTNLIHKEKYNDSIKLFLSYLASHQKIEICTLIGSHIQAIVVSLLLKRKLSHFDMTASLTMLCSFCDKSLEELLATKYTFIKGRLLLHYAIDPKSVTDGIYYLSKFEKEEHDQPFEDEFEDENCFIEYIKPSLIGILLGIDTHFTSTKKEFGSADSILQIESLRILLLKLKSELVQDIHIKLLSTLSLLLSFRTDRNNQKLNVALTDLWTVFVSKLNDDLKTSLMINICVALYDLIDDYPDGVAAIYSDIVCREVTDKHKTKLKSLFFIPDIPCMSGVYSFLNSFIRRDNSVSNLVELQQSLDCVLPLMNLESQKSRLLAITKFKQLLQSNQDLLNSNMLVNLDEPLDAFISKTIESLIASSSTQDIECSALIAECLGILGAVNPIRLDNLIYGQISTRRSLSVTNLSDAVFVVDLIERLKSSLFSDQRSESESANYALQVVVKTYNVLKGTKFTGLLSEEANRACEICKNTSYKGIKKSQPDTSSSVYEKFKLDNQYSYKDWLDKFSLNLIYSIQDRSIQEVFLACSYVFKYNLKLAEYLLPHAIIHLILHQPASIPIISREIDAILEEDIGVSTQDLDTVYTNDVLGSIQTLHFQCANMIFFTLDAIYHLNCDISGLKPRVVIPKSQSEPLRSFIAFIEMDKLAILASKCRSHARALCYFEQFLFRDKSQLDKYATTLQKIYVALDDSFDAAGIEMVRTRPTTLVDDITSFEACGRFDKAFTCCSTSLEALNSNHGRELLIEDALRCLSNQGDYHRLCEKSFQLMSEYSQYKRNILPHAIEASWKLGKWDQLRYIIKNEQVDSLLDSASVTQGCLLLSCIEDNERIPDKLKIVRQSLMKPLSIAMMDGSAYFRGYQNLLVLHSIGDFSLALDLLRKEQNKIVDENNIDLARADLCAQLNLLSGTWDKRNRLVQPSLRSLEPILEWQRSVSMVIHEKYPYVREKIGVDIGQLWLKSADSAREARSFERSFFCLTQAQRWFGSEFDKLNLGLRVKYYIGQAKLDWDQGEKTKAIRVLKLSLQRLKDHQLYKHLELRRAKNRSVDPFPMLNNLEACNECQKIQISERESFTALKMLLTHFCEEADAGIPETLFYMYEECVHLGVNQEETYFRLARYYDKLLEYYQENPKLCMNQPDERQRDQIDPSQRFSQSFMSGDRDEVYTKLMEHSIIAFGNSLKYGVRYIRESMPRLLNIWYDLGSKKSKVNQQTGSRLVSSRIESTIRFIDELKNDVLPPYYFMTAISLLLSRVCHPHSGVSKKTCEIVELLLLNYPHQITWLMIALSNDENLDRRKAAKMIFNSCRKKIPSLERIIVDTMVFSQILIELCCNHSELDKNRPLKQRKKLQGFVNVKDISTNAAKFDFNRAKVIAPVQSSIRAIIPTGNASQNLDDHVAYPEQNISYISSFEPKVRVFNSLQQPRGIMMRCANGKLVHILCKSGDDLRKDSRCTEFLDLLNRILRKDSQSNARFFEIQTFLVLPLESRSGIIEMVPNCESLRNIVDPLYKERRPDFSMHDPKRSKEGQTRDAHDYFVNKLLPMFSPPVLPTWFLRNFIEPTSWYMARLAFTRTAAVISMGGYIIGLGDRHLDNILVDTCNGRIVHVDFNLLFHQAESLPTPERVPFRLTQNVVAAFGPLGTEGNFRKVCEITMRVMRKEREALLTTLKPFMHDPCSEWVKVRDKSERGGNRPDNDERHAENMSAKQKIEVTERKLKGYPRSRQFKPLTLIDSYSVEAQVDNLIEEASDTYNLALMYFGWCPQV